MLSLTQIAHRTVPDLFWGQTHDVTELDSVMEHLVKKFPEYKKRKQKQLLGLVEQAVAVLRERQGSELRLQVYLYL